MKAAFETFAAALGVALIGTLLPATANADCGVPAPASWQGQSGFESGSLRLASDFGSRDPIVGMWKVTFIAQGNVGPGLPPDGVVVDNAFAQWHSDGTEIMNSRATPPRRASAWECGRESTPAITGSITLPSAGTRPSTPTILKARPTSARTSP